MTSAKPDRQLVATRVARIGLLRLWHNTRTGRFIVSLDNKTYHNEHLIMASKLDAWLKEFEQ